MIAHVDRSVDFFFFPHGTRVANSAAMTRSRSPCACMRNKNRPHAFATFHVSPAILYAFRANSVCFVFSKTKWYDRCTNTFLDTCRAAALSRNRGMFKIRGPDFVHFNCTPWDVCFRAHVTTQDIKADDNTHHKHSYICHAVSIW